MADKEVPVMAVKKAFDLLEILHIGNPSGQGVPLSEAARLMGMPPNSARNILKTMILCGYVEQSGDSRYLPGPKCRQMGRLNRMLSPESVECMQSILRNMTERIGEATVFTTLMGGNRIVVSIIDSNSEIRISQATIQSDSIFRTPTGRILSAFASPMELAHIISKHGMPGEAWDGIDKAADLNGSLKCLRKSGVCEILERNVYAAAVPVFGSNAQFIGSLGCYAPAFRCPQDKVREIISELKAYAAKIGDTHH